MKKKKEKRRSLKQGDLILNDKYEILDVIHTSGMANVYLVSDKNLNMQWCLKEIVKSQAKKSMVEYRSLLQEANILKSLSHPNIPRIVTIEEEGDSIFIIMDYVQGVSVIKWIEMKGPIKQDIAVKWSIQVCNVLMYLHNRKHAVFYRDMKPDNLMIQDNGNIEVVDFGASIVITENNKYITKENNLGTKGYAAPEQKSGKPFDLRSDIYALGMTMFCMVTGLNPAVIGVENVKPIREINSGLSKGLEVIIGKCIQENPKDRYQSIEEVLYALKNIYKLDSSYIKKSKSKIKITSGFLVASFLLFSLSFIPLGLYNSQQEGCYNEKLDLAIQTGRSSDYIEAISMNPTEIEPYAGLIDSLKTDGIFTKEEEKDLLGLVNPNISELRKSKDFGQFSYNMGKLYWFYYEGDDGDVVSSKWFKEALDSNFKAEESKVYYDLSSFKKNISMSVAESSDKGMYIEYWDNLMKAKEIDSGELIELQIYTSIADAISSYSYRLKTDGVSKEDILSEIENIRNYLNASNPTSEKSKSLWDKLNSIIDTLPNKVEVAYSGGVE